MQDEGDGEPFAALDQDLPGLLYRFELEGTDPLRLTFIGRSSQAVLGIDADALLEDPSLILRHVALEDVERIRQAVEQVRTVEAGAPADVTVEARVIRKDRVVDVLIHGRARREGNTVVCTGQIVDVAMQRAYQRFASGQTELMRHIAEGRPFGLILDRTCRLIEETIRGSYCTTLLMRDDGKTVRYGAAPTLDLAYMHALDGHAIGPMAGSCGAALFHGETVITEDIAHDPRWKDYVELARQYDLRACWSVPFRGADDRVAGTFATYFTSPRTPTPAELTWLETAAELCSMAAQRAHTERAIADREQQIRHLERMQVVGEMAGSVAHDFNNLLTVIRGAADLLSGDFGGSPEHQEEVEALREVADRGARLTRHLLACSRKQPWAPQSVSLQAEVCRLKDILRRVLPAHVELRLELDQDVPRVWVDPAQLEQVVLNLTMNARDALPRGGTLTIRTTTKTVSSGPPWVVLEVDDNGEGMPAEVVDRIFEPFFTTKPDGRGTGLGLAVVMGTIERAGGTIDVSSEIGRGTTFRIAFPPATDVSTAPPPLHESRPPLGAGESIFVVEDDDDIRVLLERLLAHEGYRVRATHDGREALNFIDAHGEGLDLILSDVVVPGLDGPHLRAQVAKRWPHLPVLLMSSYSDDLFLVREAIAQGAPLLQKPFTRKTLTDEVRAAMAPASEG